MHADSPTQPILYRFHGSGILTSRKLDKLFFLPTIGLMAGMGDLLSNVSVGYLLLPLSWLTYCVSVRTPPPKWLLTYAAFTLAIGAVSVLHLMPRSWQEHFVLEVIPRQLVPVFSFCLCYWAATSYFSNRFYEGRALRDAMLIIVCGLLVRPLTSLASGDDWYTIYNSYGSFINSTTILLIFLTHFLFFSRMKKIQRFITLTSLVTLGLFTHYIQFRVFCAITVAIILGAPARLTVAAVVCIFVLGYVFAQSYIPEIYQLDENAAIRLLLSRGAAQSFVDTMGIGIGYGTESVQWEYQFAGTSAINNFLPAVETMSNLEFERALSRGVHNSFMQEALRSGVIGFTLLILVFFQPIWHRFSSNRLQRSVAVIFCFSFISCFVNPALESPLQLGGIGMALGYICAAKRWDLQQSSS